MTTPIEEGRNTRWGLVMTKTEKRILETIAQEEYVSEATVVRRLLWKEAKRLGIVNTIKIEVLG